MDLKVIGFEKKITPYLDTAFFEDMGLSELDQFKAKNPRKLKDLTADFLNAQI